MGINPYEKRASAHLYKFAMMLALFIYYLLFTSNTHALQKTTMAFFQKLNFKRNP